jgi:hypothetical protein
VSSEHAWNRSGHLLPAPLLLTRWATISWLETCFVGPQRSLAEWQLEWAPSSRCFAGIHNDHLGGFAFFRGSLEGDAYFVGSETNPTMSERAAFRLANQAREMVRHAYGDNTWLLPEVESTSVGYTFAMLWKCGLQRWDDLTGRDPDCKGCLALNDFDALSSDIAISINWAVEQFEVEQASHSLVTDFLFGNVGAADKVREAGSPRNTAMQPDAAYNVLRFIAAPDGRQT